MNAQEIARHLGGIRNGRRGWLVRCPCHEDSSPSLSINDGKVQPLVVKCFAGCDARDVLAHFRQHGYLGPEQYASPYVPPPTATVDAEAERRYQQIAQAIWRNAALVAGTPAETYLRMRGYSEVEIPKTLRYHHALKYPGTEQKLQGMVAAIAVEPCREIVAIHRTFLAPDGRGKADVPQQKAMLGNCKGGAVRLAPADETLVVAEGIETTLSAMELYCLPGYAALSASGVQSLILPEVVRHVIICADRDKTTAQHPRGHGVESAHKAADRWQAEGRTVEIKLPPDGLKDFNDVVRMRASGPGI